MEVANKLWQLFRLGFKYLKFSLILIDSLLVLWWEGKPHPSGTPLGCTHPIKNICNILVKPCLILITDPDAAECVRSQTLVIRWFQVLFMSSQ